MNRNKLAKMAAANAADKIRKGETAGLFESVVGAAGGEDEYREYLEKILEGIMAGDVAKVNKNVRGATSYMSDQLVLDGMEHASFPPAVVKKDVETGEEIAVPWRIATFGEIDNHVRKNRQALNVRDRVIAAQEKTIEHLRNVGVDDHWTGAEIEAHFGSELDGQTAIEIES